MTRTGGVGSVGVIAVHYDMSVRNEKMGVKPTAIFAGKHKADFSPNAPLKEEAAAFLQASVDREYERFVEYVATGRRMETKAVRDTEASIFEGEDGIRAGFADQIGTFETALSDLSAHLVGKTTFGARAAAKSEQTGESMSQKTEPPEDKGADVGASAAEARKAASARIKAIINSEHAKGREKLANYLALETETDPQTAEAILAAAPEPVKALVGISTFHQAMNNTANPKVDPAAAGEPDSQAAVNSEVQRILAVSGVQAGKEAK
jgi:ClpP class serine protease